MVKAGTSGGGGSGGMLPREMFETGLAETSFYAFSGPDFTTNDRDDHSFPISV